MTPEDLVRMLAAPERLHAMAAVNLGADTPTTVAEMTEMSVKRVNRALHRLREQELVLADRGPCA